MSRTLHACCLILADSTRRLKWLGRLLADGSHHLRAVHVGHDQIDQNQGIFVG